MPVWAWFIIPVVIGLCQPLIIQMTIQLARVMGDMPASAVLHFVGAFTGAIFVLLGLRGGDSEWSTLPWWAWFGGAIGVCCLWLMNSTVPKLGIAPTFATIVASQLVASLVIEHFGWLGTEVRDITMVHIVGVLFLALGAFLVSHQ